ncbi:MAG: hypothetical protein JWQ98_465 [Chlorobi bacterium]|nr:hypothetical protein [Chlorobiota bacterium]
MRFAYRKEFATEPIADALGRRGWEIVATDHPGELVNQGEADIALTPSLEYAHAIGVVDYALVPGLAITTRGFAGLMRLAFNKGLISFGSMAVKDPTAAEIAIARIVLSEKHDIVPKIVKVAPDASIADMLAVADCALVVGDEAIFAASSHTSALDLTDEWEDAVEAPLPYMVAWGRVAMVAQGALDDLTAARDEGVLTLADRAALHPQSAQANAFYQRYLRGEIDYTMGEPEFQALDALYRYAFYHLHIPDIPAIKLLPDGEPATTPTRPDGGGKAPGGPSAQ